MNEELVAKGKAAKKAARVLATLEATAKNKALKIIAETIMEQEPLILAANDKDMDEGHANGLTQAMLDRLLLTAPRLESIANDVKSIITLPDPVGEEFESRRLPNN
jgi:glutamate-5-semialdehyde dehydrogenase